MVNPAVNHLVNVPRATTAAAFPRYSRGSVVGGQRSLHGRAFCGHSRCHASIEFASSCLPPGPLITCTLNGSVPSFRGKTGGVDIGGAGCSTSTSPAAETSSVRAQDPLRLALSLPFGTEWNRDPHPSRCDQCLRPALKMFSKTRRALFLR